MPLSNEEVKLLLLLETKQFDSAIKHVKTMSKGAGDALDRSAAGGGKKFVDMMSSIKVGTIAALGAARVFFRTLNQGLGTAIKTASDYREENSKLLFVFRDMTQEANKAVKTLSDYGYSILEANRVLANTGDVLTGLGIGQDQALQLSTVINTLAQDITSFTNYSGGAIQASQNLTKAVLGERDALIGMNIKITEAELKRKGYNEQMSLAQKAEITLQAIMEQSKNAIGDYARTQDSAANMTRQLQANLQNLAQVFGDRVLPVYARFVGTINDVVKWTTKQFERSQDLEKSTTKLVSLLSMRKEITDKLSGSINSLNEAQRESLQLDELNIQKEINEALIQVTRSYNKYFKTIKEGDLLKSTSLASDLNIFGYGKTELEAMENLQQKLNAGYKEQIKQLDNFVKYGRLYNDQLKVAEAFHKKELQVATEINKVKNQQKEALNQLAIAYRDGLLSETDLKRIPEEFVKQMISLANDPKFIKSLETISKKTTDTVTETIKNTFRQSFVEKIQLRIDLNMDQGKIIQDIEERLKKLQPEFDRIQARIEKYGSVGTGAGGESNKKLVDEYLALQKLKAELIPDLSAELEELQRRYADVNTNIDAMINSGSKLGQVIGSDLFNAWDGLGGQILKAVRNGKEMKQVTEQIRSMEEELREAQAAYKDLVATGDITGAESMLGNIERLQEELEKVIDRGDGLTSSLSAGFISIAQTVADFAVQLYDVYQQTGDWTEAFESGVQGLVSQIPVVGQILSRVIDAVWETQTEKIERLTGEINDAIDLFEHRIATGEDIHTQNQIEFYEEQLRKLKDIGADEKEIWRIEEKLYSLRKQQTAELEKQTQEIEKQKELLKSDTQKAQEAQFKVLEAKFQQLIDRGDIDLGVTQDLQSAIGFYSQLAARARELGLNDTALAYESKTAQLQGKLQSSRDYGADTNSAQTKEDLSAITGFVSQVGTGQITGTDFEDTNQLIADIEAQQSDLEARQNIMQRGQELRNIYDQRAAEMKGVFNEVNRAVREFAEWDNGWNWLFHKDQVQLRQNQAKSALNKMEEKLVSYYPYSGDGVVVPRDKSVSIINTRSGKPTLSYNYSRDFDIYQVPDVSITKMSVYEQLQQARSSWKTLTGESPSFHTGGLVGSGLTYEQFMRPFLSQDEIMARLQKGELVVPKNQVQNFTDRHDVVFNPTIQVYTQAGDGHKIGKDVLLAIMAEAKRSGINLGGR